MKIIASCVLLRGLAWRGPYGGANAKDPCRAGRSGAFVAERFSPSWSAMLNSK